MSEKRHLPAVDRVLGQIKTTLAALEATLRQLACSMARAAWVGAAGATAFVARTLDPAWRTLVF